MVVGCGGAAGGGRGGGRGGGGGGVVNYSVLLTCRALKAGRSSVQDAKASEAEVAPEARE